MLAIADLPEASKRGISLRGLHKLQERLELLVRDKWFKAHDSTDYDTLTTDVTDFAELPTTDIVYQ